MNRLTRLILLSLLGVALVLSARQARADLYWETVMTQQGAPAANAELTKHYLTPKAYRIEQPDMIIIMDYDTMTLYQLQPANKSYVKKDMNKMAMGPKMRNMKGKQKEEFKKFMKNMMKMEVTPTNETKTINGYKCRKYLISMMMTQQEMWVTKDIEGYDEFKTLYRDMASKLQTSPMLRMTNMAAMVNKLDGFPIQTVIKMMGTTRVSTVKKIEQKTLDKSLFLVPAGYREVPGR